MEEAKSHRRRWLFRLVVVALGTVGGFAVAEIAVRVAGVDTARVISKRILQNSRDPSLDYHCYPSNPHGEFTEAPSLTSGDRRLIDYTKHEYPLAAIRETPYVVEYRRASSRMRD